MEFFRFEDVTDGTEGKEPEKEYNQELDSLREALGLHNISEGLMPNWLPEEYSCIDVNVQESPKARSVFAVYDKGGEQLIIQIRQLIGGKPYQVEKSEDLIEIYSSDGVDYYIFANNESLQTAWVIEDCECYISGKLTMEEMKRIIDSI